VILLENENAGSSFGSESSAPYLAGTLPAQACSLGQGCVYPSSVKTLADQLDARGLSWTGYMVDMGNHAPGMYRLAAAPSGWRGRGNRAKRRFGVARR